MNERARHRTVLTTVGASFVARESCEDVVGRARAALRDGTRWFEITAEPEGGPIWINAGLLVQVGRERTPIEVMEVEGLMP